ncbi:MAG: glycosyltransferase [Bacteroidales bacterium]
MNELNKTQINIAFATDDNYVMPTSVAMASLLENNQVDVSIYLLNIEGYLSEKNKEILKIVADKYNSTIYFADVAPEQFDGFPILRHGLSSYLRLLAPKLFTDIDKLLYLDADIVVEGQILELYNTNIDDYQFAGVADTVSLNAEHLQGTSKN